MFQLFVRARSKQGCPRKRTSSCRSTVRSRPQGQGRSVVTAAQSRPIALLHLTAALIGRGQAVQKVSHPAAIPGSRVLRSQLQIWCSANVDVAPKLRRMASNVSIMSDKRDIVDPAL